MVIIPAEVRCVKCGGTCAQVSLSCGPAEPGDFAVCLVCSEVHVCLDFHAWRLVEPADLEVVDDCAALAEIFGVVSELRTIYAGRN